MLFPGFPLLTWLLPGFPLLFPGFPQAATEPPITRARLSDTASAVLILRLLVNLLTPSPARSPAVKLESPRSGAEALAPSPMLR